MIHAIRRTILPLFFLACATCANAQFERLHGGTFSIGAIGQFTTPLTTGGSSGAYSVAGSTGTTLTQTVSNQQQFTTNSSGFIATFQFHPVAWAGVETNYVFTRYSERYTFNYSSASALQTLSVPVTTNEATAAYEFHPHHIPFQPFVNVGGGAISFLPALASNQWRGTGLLEAGFDIPTHNKHFALRVEGRALVYRAPNFNLSAVSTRSWRVTDEPSLSAVYHF